jgi:MEDS: MEthanogen/methylotroph, DcmR Sensory domain
MSRRRVMTATLDFGIPGLDVAPGDHVCALYMGDAERDEILFPYLRAGVRSGDKVICIVDQDDTASVRRGISDAGDIDACIQSGQLQLHTSAQTYRRCAGDRFRTEDMITFWDDSLSPAMSGGFRFARVVGEMSWALRSLPELDELSLYESEYNRFSSRYGLWGLCLYDLERFGGGIIVDVLKTHPKILMGGMVLDNPHYLSPDEFLAQRS